MEIAPGARKRTQTWSLWYVSAAAKEARKFLNEGQYAHAVDLLEQLSEEPNPRTPAGLEVEPIDDYFELKDKGGLLGRINLRVYFAVFDSEKQLVVLGCWKKEAEGKTPKHIRIRMRGRLRHVVAEMNKRKGG